MRGEAPEGHYTLSRMPAGIDSDGHCGRCGLFIEPDEEDMSEHECPPGFVSREGGMDVRKRYDPIEYWLCISCVMMILVTKLYLLAVPLAFAAMRQAMHRVMDEREAIDDDSEDVRE